MSVDRRFESGSRIMKSNYGTLVLAILASLCIYLLRSQGTSSPIWLTVETFGLLMVAILVHRLVRHRYREGSLDANPGFQRTLFAIGAVMILAPWVSKGIQVRWLGGTGEATELVWLAMLQYAAVWQAAVATQSRHQWLSFLMSCFLAIFGLATSDREGMIQIVGPFALVSAWWLMAQYWDSIEGGFVASKSVPLVRMRMGVLLLLLVVGAIMLGYVSNHRDDITLLKGFMPTSGGNQQADASARQGVGDGEMLVAATDEAYTFGPVDSELFLESDVPSMYDLVSEIYGEATPRKKKYARAISLENRIQESEEEGTESKKNSREFSALRQPVDRENPFKPHGTDSRAVVYLIGQTPEWLRLESFDRFEDNTWVQTESLTGSRRKGEPVLTEIGNKPWMNVQSAPQDLVFPVRERIATKVIQFQSPRLLTPSLVTHVHIDRIDQPDFFGWMPDGQLMMPNRDHVPELTVVHQLLQIPQLHALRDPDHPMRHLAHAVSAHAAHGDWIQDYLQFDSGSASVATVAKHWIESDGVNDPSLATDWDRVSCIVHRLRTTFTHDPKAVPAEDCDQVLEHVLAGRRGPDYLLATTAVMMIRSLGIPCRLCRGFFASPQRYDYRSGQTEVVPEDLHTWAEVYAHGMWIPIEPTGTYPMPREYRSWQQWAIQTAWWFRDAVRNHPVRAGVMAACVAASLYFRQRILEFGISLLFATLQWTPTPFRIRMSLRLLQCRMRLWGTPRTVGATFQEWLTHELALRSRASFEDRRAFLQTVQRLAYAPASHQREFLRSHADAVHRVCWSIVTSGLVTPFLPRKNDSGTPNLRHPAIPHPLPRAPLAPN
jgi:protein-glutamine gamma-glutamyltransferase